jgi:hypothetical protein
MTREVVDKVLLATDRTEAEEDIIGSLFVGVAERCLWAVRFRTLALKECMLPVSGSSTAVFREGVPLAVDTSDTSTLTSSSTATSISVICEIDNQYNPFKHERTMTDLFQSPAIKVIEATFLFNTDPTFS